MVSFGVAFISIIVGFVLHLTAEMPFRQITAGFVKCLFGCDLKSRLREFEEENDSQATETADEKQKAQDMVDNGDVRINVSAAAEDNSVNNNGVVIRL